MADSVVVFDVAVVALVLFIYLVVFVMAITP